MKGVLQKAPVCLRKWLAYAGLGGEALVWARSGGVSLNRRTNPIDGADGRLAGVVAQGTWWANP